MIKTLIGIRLRSVLSNILGRRQKDGKKSVSRGKMVAFIIAYLYVIAVFGGLFSFYAAFTAPILISAKLDWFYFAMFTVIAFLAIFVLSVFETKGELFECKDNELLLSMPIKPRDIVLSRIFTVLIYNYLETLLVMLPAVICYIIFGGSVQGIIGSVLVILLLPLLATALASGVGYAVALLGKRFKNNSFLTVGISVVFLLLYFWGYSAFIGSMGEGESPDFVMMSQGFSGFRFVGEISLLHPIFTPVFALLSLGAALLSYYLISRSYISIVTSAGGQKKQAYREGRFKKTSQFAALAKKEFSAFISSPTYMLNSAIGIIFAVLISVAAILNKNALFSVVAELSVQFGIDLSGAFGAFSCAVLVMIACFNMISASALSLEGKKFSILRSMPVSAETFLLAKTVPAIAIPALPNLAASILMIITVEADLPTSLLMIVIPQVVGVFTSFLGIVINAMFPKFDYENEVQVVKQSLATMLSMLAATLYGFVNIVIAIVFSAVIGNALLGMIVMLLLSLLLSSLLLALILGPIKRKYNKYSV